MAVTISGSSPTFSSGYAGGTITSGTAVASTSGTSIDFTGIPSWVKRITVMFNGVSTNGASAKQIQIGSGSFLTSGYNGSGSGVSSGVGTGNASSGFRMEDGTASGESTYAISTLCLFSGNTWVFSSVGGQSGAAATRLAGGSNTTLSGTLDRVRITTINGTDTFDAGSINILYE